MRHTLVLAAFLCLIVPVTVSGDDKSAKDILGAWDGTEALVSGMKSRLGGNWEFLPEKLIETSAKGQGEYKYTVDPTKNPKEIDLTPQVGPSAGKTWRGIYVIQNDILKVCYAGSKAPEAAQKDRPKEFATQKGDGVVVLTFQRRK